MSEDLYAKVDLKKVRFQTNEKEDTNTDNNGNTDNVTIYDNFWAEGSTPPKSQDNTTDNQWQTTSVNVSSGQRNLFKAAAVFLGLLCLVLLAAIIVLVVLWIQDKNKWRMTNEKLISEKDELVISDGEKESLIYNLTLKTSELEAKNNNLTNERDKLKSVIDTTCCPAQWNKVGNSCYFTSTSKETWYDSKKLCENDNAHLLIISSEEEQKYFTTFGLRTWIGLTDEETEEDWKWVNGEPVTKIFWRDNQPDNFHNKEHCAELAGNTGTSLKNWNDFDCEKKCLFTCEKVLL